MAHHLLLPVAAILAAAIAVVPAAGYPWTVCDQSSNFSANSVYQANLDLAAAILPKNASTSPELFATAAVGAIPNQLWAMGLCRGDINGTGCLSCLTQAFIDLPNDCSYDRDGTIYYDPCILHYSTLPANDTSPTLGTYTINNDANVTSDPGRFMNILAALINATVEHAASNSTARLFATGEADLDDQEFPKVYSLAQCRPDWTPAQCRECFASIVAANLAAFGGYIGGRVLALNCTYRYETEPFFNGPAMVTIASPISPAPAPAPAPKPELAPAVPPTVGTPPDAGLLGDYCAANSSSLEPCRLPLFVEASATN
nr:unnamed protein product [Digitaria exilis]